MRLGRQVMLDSLATWTSVPYAPRLVLNAAALVLQEYKLQIEVKLPSACDRVCTGRPKPSENWTETSTSAAAPGAVAPASVSWCTRRTVRTETGPPRSTNARRS